MENLSCDELIALFNEKFPVGASVRWRHAPSDAVPHRVYTVRYEARKHSGQGVVFFVEKSGFASISPKQVDYSAA